MFTSAQRVPGYKNKNMVKKVVGYVVSVVGIVIMAIGFQMIDFGWEILNIVNLDYIAGFGLVLVGIGVLISLMGEGRGSAVGGRQSGKDEIPIFEGVGNSRRIVGYRKG